METPYQNRHDDIASRLAAPFDPKEVRVRTQAGRQLHYITARTAMNRLDEVLGAFNWWDEYIAGENSVLCRLTVRLPDGSTVTKSDAGGYAGMPDQGDDDKAGYSDAFKRAAVKFGVGRYLYRDGVPAFAREREPEGGQEPEGERLTNAKPEQPRGRQDRGQDAPRGNQGQSRNGDHKGPPRSGRALFAWTKEMETKYEIGLLKYLNSWAKLQEYPGRMVDWNAEQVERAHEEASRKIQAIAGEGGDPYEEALAN